MRALLIILIVFTGCLNMGESEEDIDGEFLKQDENYMDVFVLEDYAYVTSNWGLHIIDISGKPEIVGRLKTPGQAEGVYVYGDIAYIADSLRGMVLVNVSRPYSPEVVSRLERKGNIKQVAIDGGLAYFGNFHYEEGVVVLNSSDPKEPGVIASYDPPGYEHVRDITVRRGLIFLADFTGGLKVLNATRLLSGENSSLIADVPLRGVAYSVEVLDNYAIVACSDAGLALLDMTNASSPEVLSYSSFSKYAIKVGFSRDTIFASTGTEGILAIKLEDGRLKEVGRYNSEGNAYGFHLDGKKVYLADHTKGLAILNASDPSRIKLLSGITPGGEAY